MTKFDEIYQSLIQEIMMRGSLELNKRTGHKTKALPGLHFSIDVEKEGFPLLTLRKIPIKMFVAEQIWFISGARKPEDFLRNFTKIWDSFTNPGNVVTVAYGYRWRKHFGRDQLGELIKLLTHDPSSRQGVVVTWDPSSDGLLGVSKKNVPCPYTFTVNIIEKKLHLHNMVRSNDMILGFPADVAGFALLQAMLASHLNVSPGVYSHSISNAHIYDNQFLVAEELLQRSHDHNAIHLQLPKNVFTRAEKKDLALVEEIVSNFETQYHPLPSIKGLHVVI